MKTPTLPEYAIELGLRVHYRGRLIAVYDKNHAMIWACNDHDFDEQEQHVLNDHCESYLAGYRLGGEK
ncbi:MAG: hypothetical protein ACQKBW_07125 [Puniceicoccales bacterium]